MEMHDNKAPRGKAYYVIPHGKVDDDDAMKIIARSDVYAFDEGLFPGNPQCMEDCVASSFLRVRRA